MKRLGTFVVSVGLLASAVAQQSLSSSSVPAPLAIALASAAPSLADSTPEIPFTNAGYVFRTNVREVRIDFRVKDSTGRPVTAAGPQDFRVYDNMQRLQTISDFRAESNLPLSIAILIDSSGSTAKQLPQEKQVAIDFLRKVLRPGDKALIAGFNTKLTVAGEFSDDLNGLEQNVARIQSGGITAFHDSLVKLCGDYFRAPDDTPRRRVLVVITDGVDNYSLRSIDDGMEAAIRADLNVFAISVGNGSEKSQPSRNLRMLAKATGGEAYFPEKLKNLDATFEQINQELRTFFLVTYRAPSSPRDNEFRQVNVISAHSDWKVDSKVGYYAHE